MFYIIMSKQPVIIYYILIIVLTQLDLVSELEQNTHTHTQKHVSGTALSKYFK